MTRDLVWTQWAGLDMLISGHVTSIRGHWNCGLFHCIVLANTNTSTSTLSDLYSAAIQIVRGADKVKRTHQ